VISHEKEKEGVEVVRGIFAALGSFSVKFRWPIVGFWIVVAIGSTALLPSLTDKAKGSDQDFLPTSAPSIRAVQLAAPFGATSVTPISVVIARSSVSLPCAVQKS
jgi:uncharacterized membrane protein YdfJ with MMPL/SSD domain